MPNYRRLSDPRELRALAHPVRLSIVELLSTIGPMTATELAERLDESPANCSWHLRKLADFDFVEEAEGAQGRRRPWKMTRIGTTYSDEGATAETRRAASAFGRMVIERRVDRLHASVEMLREETDGAWRTAGKTTDHASWLTPDELRAMNDEIFAVMRRHEDRLADPGRRPPGSRLCEFVAWGMPSVITTETVPEDAGDA